MKNVPIIASLFLLLTSAATATTRVVKQDGYQGAYATIQAAIDSAQAGDSVVVYPRFDGFAWQENLNIEKELFLASSEDTMKFHLIGQLAVKLPDGGALTILGFKIQGCWFCSSAIYNADITVLDTGASSTNRSKLNIIDCEFVNSYDTSLYVPNDNYDVSIIGSKLGNVYFKHGRVIGSTLSDLNIEVEYSNPTSSDSIIIIGNISGTLKVSSNEKISVFNNKLLQIIIYQLNNIGTSQIINNSFYLCGYGGYNWSPQNVITSIYFPYGNYQSRFEIMNNISFCNDPPTAPARLVNQLMINTSLFNAKYNAIVSTYNPYNYPFSIGEVSGSPDNLSYKYFITAATIDLYGRLTSPEARNKGYYLPEYTDIDLTRNDLGTYGGPYSINNYHYELVGGSGKGRIHWLNIPRSVNSTSTPINITGEGHVVR